MYRKQGWISAVAAWTDGSRGLALRAKGAPPGGRIEPFPGAKVTKTLQNRGETAEAERLALFMGGVSRPRP